MTMRDSASVLSLAADEVGHDVQPVIGFDAKADRSAALKRIGATGLAASLAERLQPHWHDTFIEAATVKGMAALDPHGHLAELINRFDTDLLGREGAHAVPRVRANTHTRQDAEGTLRGRERPNAPTLLVAGLIGLLTFGSLQSLDYQNPHVAAALRQIHEDLQIGWNVFMLVLVLMLLARGDSPSGRR